MASLKMVSLNLNLQFCWFNLLKKNKNKHDIQYYLIQLAIFAVVIAVAAAFPQSYDSPTYEASDYKPSYPSSYKPGYANGRVKIQVYRGPNKEYGKGYETKGYGYDDGAFAPWGFYVTQPEDNKAYYGNGY